MAELRDSNLAGGKEALKKKPLCLHISQQLHDAGHFVQAYAELLELSNNSSHDEVRAVSEPRRFVSRYPVGARIGVRLFLPLVADQVGHIPNLLQDLMMQIFAGLPLASELDLAVTAFRDQGRWQANLQHLPGNPGSNNVVPGVCAEPLAIDDPCAEAPAADVNPAVNAPTFPTHLHQHPCHRRVSAACGTRRRCRMCNVRIARRTVYFHCAHNCRFTVCADCFRPSSRA